MIPFRRLLPIGLVLSVGCLAGCGGYAGTSEQFRKALTRGQPAPALDQVNEALGVQRAEDLPSEPNKDTPLLLLERAAILQALGRYELSSRDFQSADQNLEVLDLTSDTAGSIGKYLFSDDATVYKAPPHEKLLLNTLNMINYLARGDLGGARVESRRLVINAKYFENTGEEARSMLALGSYLAGFTYEMSGRPGPAMRHYGDALEAGGLPTLIDAARRLMARTGAKDPRVADAVGDPGEAPPDDDHGELLVLVQTGMAPYYVPERLPIGAAVVAASNPGPGARLSPAERRRANTFAAKGILKWVNYPRLTRVRDGRPRVGVRVDGRGVEDGLALNVTDRVLDQYEQIKGTLIAASITRLLTRAVAGEASQAITKKSSGNGLAGLLVGLAVEGALTAADTPDTRSWVSLPDAIFVSRTRVPPGEHTVEVSYRGRIRRATVDIAPNGWAVVNFSDLR